MLTRLAAMGAALGVVALTAGSMGPATGNGDHHGHHGSTIRVLSTNTEEDNVDVGDPGLSLGDEFVFTSNLTRHGKSVGHTGVVCTVTSVAREETQCAGTASFNRGGQIAIQGLVAGERQVFSFPITGGTGAFEGADGTLVVKEVSDNQELLTFFLD